MDNNESAFDHLDHSSSSSGGQNANSKAYYVAGQAGVAGQGPHMLIVLQVKENLIVKAQFSTYGCPAAVACGQFVTEQVEGKDWRDVQQADICGETIIAGIGQMPLGREHCPALTIGALRQALEQLLVSSSGTPA